MYNRKKIRLPGFDYSSKRSYFITINVRNHSCAFGAIVNRDMRLSGNGIIALEQWQWLGNQYPYINLLSFVVMPDHVHGIIQINPNYVRKGRDPSLHDTTSNIVRKGRDPSLHDPDRDPSLHATTSNIVRQGHDPSLHATDPDPSLPKIKPLHELIGAYKTTVSKRIHIAGDPFFRWHNSYHDHIIRNDIELARIIRYIEDNPAHWDCKDGSRPGPALSHTI